MNGKTTLKRLEKLAKRRDGRTQIDTIEVWCEGELRDVMPLGAKVIAVVNVDIDRV